jgi:hypothetical protein
MPQPSRLLCASNRFTDYWNLFITCNVFTQIYELHSVFNSPYSQQRTNGNISYAIRKTISWQGCFLYQFLFSKGNAADTTALHTVKSMFNESLGEQLSLA